MRRGWWIYIYMCVCVCVCVTWGEYSGIHAFPKAISSMWSSLIQDLNPDHHPLHSHKYISYTKRYYVSDFKRNYVTTDVTILLVIYILLFSSK